ncbi:NADH dehydrogenase subunit 1 (mitochondrion) [Penicillium canescens]|uniref:NADH-ubiquinone oxidoreductase chain 1 n=1 Tax=Penicillium canescens TaxID=5083 RepID=A0A8A6C4J8_PENCN|nr:NADH dehydrogenase subunit 1 [Penicillium canescens]QTH79182.1 NADH dehydrogenase subunit 1 [Penicillium canescens]
MISIISVIEGLLLIVPALLSVAFVTIAERKTMASMQRRLGPNAVGYYGLLQAFADALKLLLKEYVAPTQANILLFFIGPMITLIFALLGYLVVPFDSGIFVSDYSLGMLYMLAVSSVGTYGILLAGWSANSKYAFLGSLRSTAQLISYELILSSVILLVILLTGNLNMITIVESQRIVDFLLPLFPLFIIFFIGSIAETNRAPFDLAEAESELVSGFMTEHSASVFVFFFLAEYASIILICVLNSILFLGGYLCIIPVDFLIDILSLFGINNSILEVIFVNISSSPLNLAFKTAFLIFVFIWTRASFPRIRFDQLMSVCWTVLLPLIIAYVVLLPCVVYGLDALPTNLVL